VSYNYDTDYRLFCFTAHHIATAAVLAQWCVPTIRSEDPDRRDPPYPASTSDAQTFFSDCSRFFIVCSEYCKCAYVFDLRYFSDCAVGLEPDEFLIELRPPFLAARLISAQPMNPLSCCVAVW
jgi:hypothetical protein